MTLGKNYLLQLWTAIGSHATAPTGQPAFAHWTLRKEWHVVRRLPSEGKPWAVQEGAFAISFFHGRGGAEPGLGVSIARLLQEPDDTPRLRKVQPTVCNPLVIGSEWRPCMEMLDATCYIMAWVGKEACLYGPVLYQHVCRCMRYRPQLFQAAGLDRWGWQPRLQDETGLITLKNRSATFRKAAQVGK